MQLSFLGLIIFDLWTYDYFDSRRIVLLELKGIIKPKALVLYFSLQYYC